MNHRVVPVCLAFMMSVLVGMMSSSFAQGVPAKSLVDALERERTLLQAELQAVRARQKKSAVDQKATLERLRKQIASERVRYESAWRRVLLKERELRLLDASTETAPVSEDIGVSLSQLEGVLGLTSAKGQSQEQRIDVAFKSAAARIIESSRVRQVSGQFFLRDGTLVEGTIIRVGVVAAAGVTGAGRGGVLVPMAPSSLEFEVVHQAGDEISSYLQGTRHTLPVIVYDPEAPPSATELALDTSSKQEVSPHTWRDTITDAAPVGYVILSLGALALLVMVLRLAGLAYMSLREHRIGKQLLSHMHEHHHERALDDLRQAAQTSRTALARITLQALSHRQLPLALYENSVQATLIVEVGRVSRGLSALRAIAAVSPLLGLLGTVIGMITTFEALTVAGSASDPQALSGGIAQALATTQLGLVVAVPALLAYSVLHGWASHMEAYIEHLAVEIAVHIRELSLLGDVDAHEHGDES